MFQTRSLTTGFLVASLGIAAGLAVVTSPNLASADDCGNLKVDEVQKVCKSGGVAAVKKAMKDAMDAANKAGAKIDGKEVACKSCHTDQSKYATSPAAETEFKKNLLPHFNKK